mmetsp:Transcript_17835/g.53794  ORF Transcript_17835/g.53794 Transcript_17835/m.53794 type:complete len:231 (+) Transcript_17835:251-943(+)
MFVTSTRTPMLISTEASSTNGTSSMEAEAFSDNSNCNTTRPGNLLRNAAAMARASCAQRPSVPREARTMPTLLGNLGKERRKSAKAMLPRALQPLTSRWRTTVPKAAQELGRRSAGNSCSWSARFWKSRAHVSGGREASSVPKKARAPMMSLSVQAWTNTRVSGISDRQAHQQASSSAARPSTPSTRGLASRSVPRTASETALTFRIESTSTRRAGPRHLGMACLRAECK